MTDIEKRRDYIAKVFEERKTESSKYITSLIETGFTLALNFAVLTTNGKSTKVAQLFYFDVDDLEGIYGKLAGDCLDVVQEEGEELDVHTERDSSSLLGAIVDQDKLKLQKQLEAKEFQSDVENDAYFFNTFSAEIAEINEDIEKLKNAAAQLTDSEKNEEFLAINSRCEQARTFLRDSTRFLNKHRIQSCSEAVDGILQKTSALRSEIQPKKKFTFKSRKIASKAPTATVESTEDKNKKFSIECGFQDKSKEILTIKDVNDRNVELDNIQDCIIHIEGNPSTVHCRHIKQSTILIGPVTTSVFIDSCNDSVFALSCQQLRCHDSSFCQFYLHVTSNAIIENCKKFEFAENTYSYSDMKKDYDRSKLNETNNWMNVKDFNWLSDTEASPNWSKISHSEMIHDWTDKLVIETTRIANLSSS